MSAGCARRVMRKHILRIFCALKARISPTFFHALQVPEKNAWLVAKIQRIYSVDGVRRSNLQKGINIVISGKGKAKKVYVK